MIAECVDPSFLSVARGPGAIAHFAFLVLVVLNLVAGFQALGTLLAVGIMMLPAAAARFWSRDLDTLLLAAIAIAIASSISGLLVSYHLSLASGPSIIMSAGVIYFVSLLVGPVSGVIWNFMPQRHRSA